jgi:HEAT repeat protein
LFESFAQRFPQSKYLPASLYWQAFCLYRAGSEADLRRALKILDEAGKQFPATANEADVSALTTRVVGSLASRGDSEAASRLRAGAARGESSCDQEEAQVRAEALTALVQNDPSGSMPVLRRILARRDECSVPLRRRAVYLLGKDGDASRVDEVLEIARNDPSPEVRSDAIARLAQIPGERSTAVLEQFLTSNTDEKTQRSVIQALRGRDDPQAGRIIRKVIERDDLAEPVRIDAIRSLGGGSCCFPTGWRIAGQPSRQGATLSDADVALLRGVFERSGSADLKAAVIETMARSGGSGTDAWLIGLVKNTNEDLRFRRAALGRLRRAETQVEDLGRLYDGLTERELRMSLVQVLGERDEPAATDKLIEIAKTGTDPVIRRAAISALARKKDPRTTKLLLELVEK